MSEPVFTLREGAAKVFLNLRLDIRDPDSTNLAARVADALGCPLPTLPNHCERGEAATAYWLGPDEWLLAMPHGAELATEQQLRQALADCGSAVVDVTGAYALFELHGKKTEEVLRKSSPYDFRTFAPRRCVQTVFAKTNALIAALPDDGYELIARASYADYVRKWIAAATAEYDQLEPSD